MKFNFSLLLTVLILKSVSFAQLNESPSQYQVMSIEQSTAWVNELELRKEKSVFQAHYQTYLNWTNQGIFQPETSYTKLIPMFREMRLRNETLQLIRDRDLLYGDKDGACHCGKCTKH